MGIELGIVGLILKCNLGASLGMTRAKDGTDEAGLTATNKTHEERAGIKRMSQFREELSKVQHQCLNTMKIIAVYACLINW